MTNSSNTVGSKLSLNRDGAPHEKSLGTIEIHHQLPHAKLLFTLVKMSASELNEVKVSCHSHLNAGERLLIHPRWLGIGFLNHQQYYWIMLRSPRLGKKSLIPQKWALGNHPIKIFEKTTLPKTNIAPENGWLEDEFPFGMAYFQVLC